MNYASDPEGADRVVEKIKAAGGKAIAVQTLAILLQCSILYIRYSGYVQ